jgi:hypothetical protein
MPVTMYVPESRRCRTRALECRAMAGSFRGQFAREQMLKVATNYDRMAQDAKIREIAQGISHLTALVASRYSLR